MGFSLYQVDMFPGLPRKMSFEQDSITIGEFFDDLSDQYGKQVLANLFDREDKLSCEIMVVLNGDMIRAPQILSTVIPPESQMMISVLIAGG